MWAIGILIVVVIVCGVFAARGRLGQLGPAVEDRPGPDLGDGAITADDLRMMRFAVVTRGYAPAQVDAVLDRIAVQLRSANGNAGTDSSWHVDPANTLPAVPAAPSPAPSAPLGDNRSIGVSDGVRDDEKRGSNGSNEAPNR
ncbi:DivIVA domain-containing protein [Propionibacterium sp.]|uniref:DivIVA domain-containing protein n=1 Tax=Propionibacterium sp. TaxID=1977903 RepID=UPI0039ED825F